MNFYQSIYLFVAFCLINAAQAQSVLSNKTFYNETGRPYSYASGNTWTADNDGDGKIDSKATYVVKDNVIYYTYQELPKSDPCPVSARRSFRFTLTETSLTLTPESDDCAARAKQWQPVGSSRTYYNQTFYEKKVAGTHSLPKEERIEFWSDGSSVLWREVGKPVALGKWKLTGPLLLLESSPGDYCQDNATYLVSTNATSGPALLSSVCDYCHARRALLEKLNNRP